MMASSSIIAFLLPILVLHTFVKAENMQESFLSASFSTSISPVTNSFFDDIQKEAFCNASEHFFNKVFADHDANINILSVAVFDEYITKHQSGAEVSAEKLRFRQYPRDHALTFSTVVVAQHLDEKKQLMSAEHFHQNVLHASHEFQGRFRKFDQRELRFLHGRYS